MKCPRCETDNREGARFCRACGATLDVVCASCGAAVQAGSRFCDGCGAPLAALPAPGPARFASPESYTPKHLAEKILTSKAALEGERKHVTVLFADVKGSMELLADRDPEEARALLDPVLERMMDAVHRYEGTVNQVMGDGIMALFGAPLAHEDHAVRACYAALRMQESLKRYADDTRRSHGVEVQVRVGLNSGEVVVRSVGSDLRMDYTAVGQTTHLAARMEQLAPPGSVRLTGETLRLVEGYVEVRSLGPIPVKGLPDPIEVFELTGAGQARTRLQAAALRGLTRFVGRDAEVEHLRRVLGSAGAGRGQVVAIVGEAGVGKSRLTYEFTHSHRVRDWLILEASSVSYGRATSYLPVIDLLKGYFKIEDRDDHREMRAKVLGRVLGLDRALEPLLPPLLALLDVPVEDAAWQALEPPQRRHRTLDAVKRLLLRESQAQPLLVVFEDLHWIDGETQALLDSLVESLGSAPLLLLVNYRPEYEHRWGSKTAYSQLRLDTLPAESAAALLAALLGQDPGLVPLTQMLVKRGNPFFLEETVRTLVETGALVGERGAYRLTRPVETLRVPATVQTILTARIDRLPAAEKQLLQAASVIGKHVPFALLAAITDQPEEALRRGLARLQEAEFLYETQLFPDPEYTFKHALTHEVTYGTLLQARRRTLHARVVDAIEASYPARLTEYVERLAHHALAAEEWPRAARYCYTAGERAMGQARYAAGATFYEATIRALDSQGEGADLGLKLDACLELWVTRIETGQAEGLQELGETIDALARALDDRQRLAQVRVRLAQGSWNVWCGPGGLPTAIERAREAFDLADPIDLRTRAYARFLMGAASLALGRFGDAVREFDAGVAEFAAAPPDMDAGGLVLPIRASLRAWQAEAYTELGDFHEAIASAAEARQVANAIAHPQSRWFTAAASGYVLLTKGEIAAAARAYADGLAVAQEHELVAGTYALSLGLANCQFLLGQREDGMKTLPRDVDLFATPGPGFRTLCRYGSLTASAYLAAGLLRDAQAEIARGLALATAENAATYLVPLTRLRAEALALAGPEHHDEAVGCWQRAIDMATALGMRPELARCHLGLGTRLRATQAPERAREHLGTAASRCREMDMPFWLEQAETALREL